MQVPWSGARRSQRREKLRVERFGNRGVGHGQRTSDACRSDPDSAGLCWTPGPPLTCKTAVRPFWASSKTVPKLATLRKSLEKQQDAGPASVRTLAGNSQSCHISGSCLLLCRRFEQTMCCEIAPSGPNMLLTLVLRIEIPAVGDIERAKRSRLWGA